MPEYDPTKHGDADIIFAGGGTAASVAAGRLAKNNPDLKILLIEGGANSFDDPTVRNPALYLTHLAPESKSAIFYKSSASKHLNNREAVVPAGGILGGGSAINFLMYTRAQGIDFDTWDTPGWAAKDIIPLCKKLETFHQDEPGINKDIHGYDGPVHVSDGGFRSKSEKDFISTIEKMGMKEIVDLQDFTQNDGWSRWQRYASKDGKRQDAAFRYLHPLVEGGKHPNLFILVHSKVVRVLFDTSGSGPPKATGVEYQPTPTAQPQTQLSKPVRSTINAKLVVVSSGALGTPQILERSGVGNPEILKQAGVTVVANVPGVGENYQDHHLTLYPFKSSLGPEETLDDLLSGRQEFSQLAAAKNPILGWNGIDICCKIQMTKEEVESQDAQFQKDWKKDFANYPTRPLMLCGIVNAFLADASLVDPGQYITFGCYTAYPWSTGSIHIKSADDVLAGYDFDAGFFSHPSDVNIQVWGYKKAREIARRLPYCTGEVGLGHPVFQDGSSAKLVDSGYTASVDGDIKYSAEDNAVIEDWVRGNVNTTWHSLGTCAMKPLENGGVVDANLNVHGTSGLKVVDLSIVPTNVGANTNNTALVVGEKAATIIAAELGLKL